MYETIRRYCFLWALFSTALVAPSGLFAQHNSSIPMGSLRSVLLPSMDIRLPAEVDGIVSGYLVGEGDRVTKGQVIVQLKAEEERLRMAQAEANLMAANAELMRAEKSLARVERLSEQGIPSEKDLELAVFEADRARANVKQAEASLQLAKGANWRKERSKRRA